MSGHENEPRYDMPVDPRYDLPLDVTFDLLASIFGGDSRPLFRGKNQALAAAVVDILEEGHPMTLRHLFYLCVSAGALKNLDKEYKRLLRVTKRLREHHAVPLNYIVDTMRQSTKPSSWSGLVDFGDTVVDAYRKDLWSRQVVHLEVFTEKDAVAATLQEVTEAYDVGLNVCRGYASIGFAAAIAEQWKQIKKPIMVFYVGDWDPDGLDVERDLRAKLERYSGRTDDVEWERLATVESDFEDFGLLPLPAKKKGPRTRAFIEEHGDRCSELDALPPKELRQRLVNAIESMIDQEEWQRLKRTEDLERQACADTIGQWAKVG